MNIGVLWVLCKKAHERMITLLLNISAWLKKGTLTFNDSPSVACSLVIAFGLEIYPCIPVRDWARGTSSSQNRRVLRNDAIIVFFNEAYKNKDNAKLALASFYI